LVLRVILYYAENFLSVQYIPTMLRDVLKSKSKSELVTEFIVMIVTLLISTFLLRFMWNKSLARHISVLKPISGLTDAFLLSCSLAILRGC